MRDLRWLLDSLAAEAPGVRAVIVVSSDGLPLLATDPVPFEGGELATVVSGLASLTSGAADLMEAGPVKQTMVAMDDGCLLVMTVGDGALLGVLTTPDADLNVVCYHMALFVGRAGHVLTPELRTELRRSLEPSGS
ncbi:roadblock/LC7 domain-containing protein [Streptomyces sp. A7024]|uniref:Roadblock/LC7 domain-containing protein n=2 Tax=Streptomyces TaxID=1883 RepID=A0A6G4U4N5_9ACTN|nr:roadblock/LC7 domain-containing protein [Streptomyces coryli]NGN66338.1 roadblock/LC7 domain-containing protein [Streptomyces coryli]